jgi:hypothetical protein
MDGHERHTAGGPFHLHHQGIGFVERAQGRAQRLDDSGGPLKDVNRPVIDINRWLCQSQRGYARKQATSLIE